MVRQRSAPTALSYGVYTPCRCGYLGEKFGGGFQMFLCCKWYKIGAYIFFKLLLAYKKALITRFFLSFASKMEMDLLHPDPIQEAKKHKLKRLIPNPKSFFMDVKCPGCYSIATVFSHAQTVVLCGR